jgi:DNA polymerase III delta prime subunit
MPCAFDELPGIWTAGGPERLFRYLSVLFPNTTELYTIMWIIANSVIDPGATSKFLLYGPGGTGKSTVIKAIERLLIGCCSTIKPGTLTDPRDDINLDTAKAIASNRMLTAGEINLESNKLNLHNVKVMTGHDTISVPPIKVATRCSIVAGCNDLPDPSAQKSWTSTAISRRMVVTIMDVKTSAIPKRQMPDSVEDLQDFLMSCVYIKLTYPSMPISTRCVLYTILGDRYNYVHEKIEISEGVSDQDMFDANTQIEIYLNLPLHLLGELASVISTDTVKTIGTLNFVKI